MNFKIKSLTSIFVAVVLVIGGLAAPAMAVGPTISIVSANDSLAGSTIAGFDANATLRLAVIAESGGLSWTDNGSGVNKISNGSNGSPLMWLAGNQAQLNAALSEITINKPCSGSYKIYAQVTESGFLQHPVTHHLYKYNLSPDSLDNAIAIAAATPLVSGGVNTFGYVTTIGDKVENQIVTLLGAGMIAASDSVTEGDWKWLTGPEAGTSFYSGDFGGSTLTGKYSSWNSGEPNNSGNEDYIEMYGDGNWNDTTQGYGTYAMEFGGMPGDDLSAVSIPADSLDINVQGPFTGNGTQESPFLIPDLAALRGVAGCTSTTNYFKQTANITLPNDWAGDQTFQGHYDGNGKTISFSPGTVATHSNFGVWSYTENATEISDLTITGDLVATNYSRVGLLFGSGYDLTANNVNVSGSITSSDGSNKLGGLMGSGGGTLNHVHSTVNLYSTGGSRNDFGGIAGYFYGSINDSSWHGEMNISGSGETYRVGGLISDTDCVNINRSSASGTITISNAGFDIGGIAGYFCGTMRDTKSNVNIIAIASNGVGGIVGINDGELYSVAAYGNVSGFDGIGGLVGDFNYGSVQDAYAHGNVTATNTGGSLVGFLNYGQIQRAYSTGTVTAQVSRGAFGESNYGDLGQVHWVPSESTVPEPGNLFAGEIPYTSAQSKDISYYTNEGWDISTNSGSSTWTICERGENGYPFLSALFTEDPCLLAQTLTPTPTVTGTGVEGSQLTGVPGTWDSGVSLVFAWLADGQVIANETSTSYTPIAGDVGKTITFRVTGSKVEYQTVVKTSLGTEITARQILPNVNDGLSVTVGGFRGNSWWVPVGFWKGIKAGVKAHKSATTITCVGIVAPGGSKSWQKKLGLSRAALACATAKFFDPKLKTKLTWKISKSSDKVQRGATIRFNR